MITEVFLDLDGVFTEFFETANKIVGFEYHMNPPGAWKILEKEDHFFLKLPIIPGSIEIYNAVKHLPCRVLTALVKPTGNLHQAAEDKQAWVKQYLDPGLSTICAVNWTSKSIWAHKTALLIDDSYRNCNAWQEAGGIAIHHTDNKTLIELSKLLGEQFNG